MDDGEARSVTAIASLHLLDLMSTSLEELRRRYESGGKGEEDAKRRRDTPI